MKGGNGVSARKGIDTVFTPFHNLLRHLCRNGASAREGIDTSPVAVKRYSKQTRRNGVLAREGIDTGTPPGKIFHISFVEMEPQPERALQSIKF